MATLTPMGYKMPQTGERNFFPHLEFNITRTDQHTHDGTNGVKINVKDLAKTTQTIPAANWVAVAGKAGTFRQLVTLPLGSTVDEFTPKFYITGGAEDGHQIYPSIEKASVNTFYIYINDNSVSLKVLHA